MTDTKTTKDTKEGAEDRHIENLQPGDPLAGYVSPDLSWKNGQGILPPEELEWNEARDTAQEEDHDRVEAAEGEASATRAKEREEQAEEDGQARRARLEHEQAVSDAIANTPTGKAASAGKPVEKKSS